MTAFLVLRHAQHDWVGRGIAGRQPDVSLNEQGRQQAHELVQRLAGVPIDRIVCSPQPRTHQTAQPIATARGLPIETHAGIDEVDMGDWVGMSFQQLEALGEPWRHWCERRGSAHPPGGEAFVDVPLRAMKALRGIHQAHPQANVLVVSHGDVIKSMVATVMKMSLDDLETFDIQPASATRIHMQGEWARVELLNATGPLLTQG